VSLAARWAAACTLAWLLGSTIAIGPSSARGLLAVAALTIAALMGAGQALALGRRVPRWWWGVATAVGWLLGFVLRGVLAVDLGVRSDAAASEASAYALMLLASGLEGAVIALVQAPVLARRSPRWLLWLPASGAAWAFARAVGFEVSSSAIGAAYGIPTGLVLSWLLTSHRQAPRHDAPPP
jgi:hypothetical protein